MNMFIFLKPQPRQRWTAPLSRKEKVKENFVRSCIVKGTFHVTGASDADAGRELRHYCTSSCQLGAAWHLQTVAM